LAEPGGFGTGEHHGSCCTPGRGREDLPGGRPGEVHNRRTAMLHRSRPALVLALLAPALVPACATTPPPPPAPPSVTAEPGAPATPAAPSPDEAALPPLLRELELTPAQMEAVLKLNDDLDRDGEGFLSAADALGRSVAGAARQCKGETPFVEMDASR